MFSVDCFWGIVCQYGPCINVSASFRNAASQGIPVQDAVSQGDYHPHNGETTSKQVTFSDTVSSIEMDEPDMEGHQIGRDPSANWGSPYLPPVPEEPSSSFSEGDNSSI